MPVDPLQIAQLARPLPPGGVASPQQSSFNPQQQQVNAALAGVGAQGSVTPAYGSGNRSTVTYSDPSGSGRSDTDIKALGYAATSSGGNVGGVIGKGPEEFKTVLGEQLSGRELQEEQYDIYGEEGYMRDSGEYIDSDIRGGNKAVQKAYRDDVKELREQKQSGEISKDEFKAERREKRKSKRAVKKETRQERREGRNIHEIFKIK